MDFALTPADHIAIVAGIVLPSVAGIVAATVAVVRHIIVKSRALDAAIGRLDAVENELKREQAKAQKTHRELFERVRHVDTAIAALSAKVDILLARKPHV